MRKTHIAGLLLLGFIVILGINIISNPPGSEENLTNVEDQIESPQTPEDPEEQESEEPVPEEIEVITCLDIPDSPEWGSDLETIEASVDEGLLITAQMMGASNDLNGSWSQVQMDMTGTWYASHYDLSIEPHENATAIITPPEPGIYRLKYTTTGGDYLVDVQATAEHPHKWDMKGVIFGDVWGELGAPEFNIAPDDPDCREEALLHAMTGPERINANYVGIVPAAFYAQVLPSPTYLTEGNFLSLTNESYYGDFVDSAHAAGFKVIHTEQLAIHWDLTPEDQEALETVWEDPVWVETWFEEWIGYVVPRAEMAERYGVEMFLPYLFPDVDTFKAENYVEEWRKVLLEIREVYSGEIAFNVINADERLSPLVDDLDAVLITLFPGLYTSSLEDQFNPKVEEITEITMGSFNAPKETIADKIPIYYVFTCQSTDGQIASEDAEWKLNMTGVDFEEQVIYYEGFFKALENETWVNGVISERWDYFDQYRRTGSSYEAAYFDMTREASPRCKPAEDVIGFWYRLR